MGLAGVFVQAAYGLPGRGVSVLDQGYQPCHRASVSLEQPGIKVVHVPSFGVLASILPVTTPAVNGISLFTGHVPGYILQACAT
jgi:hypothetical protein